MRSPSAAALQRAAVAGIAGAGIALVGLSVSGFAGLDSNLKAATDQQSPAVHQDRDYRVVRQEFHPCPRPGAGDTGGSRSGHPSGEDATTTGSHQPT
jgi:hypothetical protein